MEVHHLPRVLLLVPDSRLLRLTSVCTFISEIKWRGIKGEFQSIQGNSMRHSPVDILNYKDIRNAGRVVIKHVHVGI